MIKNANTYTEFVARPERGDSPMEKQFSWGVNAHIDAAEGWMD